MDAPHPIADFGNGVHWAGLFDGGDNPAPASAGTPDTAGGPVSMNPDAQVGTGDLTGAHNTPLHVGGLIILAVGVAIALQLAGFRFVVSAGVGS